MVNPIVYSLMLIIKVTFEQIVSISMRFRWSHKNVSFIQGFLFSSDYDHSVQLVYDSQVIYKTVFRILVGFVFLDLFLGFILNDNQS